VVAHQRREPRDEQLVVIVAFERNRLHRPDPLQALLARRKLSRQSPARVRRG
jgi:hypothetical protein